MSWDSLWVRRSLHPFLEGESNATNRRSDRLIFACLLQVCRNQGTDPVYSTFSNLGYSV